MVEGIIAKVGWLFALVPATQQKTAYFGSFTLLHSEKTEGK